MIQSDGSQDNFVSKEFSFQERSNLVLALEDALLVAPKKRSVDRGLFWAVHVLLNDPPNALPALRELLQVLSSVPALEHFQHARQFDPWGDYKIDLDFLTEWLIARGQQVGAKQCITDLEHYLNASSIEITTILAATVRSSAPESIVKAGEYEIVPWNNLPLNDNKWNIELKNLYNLRLPTTAVVSHDTICPIHLKPWDETPTLKLESIEPMIDVLRCMTVIMGASYKLTHFWREGSEWAPWYVDQSDFGVDNTTRPLSMDTNTGSWEQVRAFYECFNRLDNSFRERYRIPIDTLNKSILQGSRLVDAAIGLGITLESLYVPKKSLEGVGLLLRTRAAKFLGGDPEIRHKNAKTLKDVYDLRSRAIHSGRFDADKTWKDSQKIMTALEDGRLLARKTIQKLIVEGEPNWDDLDLGIEP